MHQNLGLLPEIRAEEYGDKAFIIYQDQEITYKEFNRLSNRLANGLLSLGVKRGDRVGIYLPNHPDVGSAYYAIQKIGAIAVLINYLTIGTELSYILNDASITMAITDKLGQENLDQLSTEISDLNRIIVKNGESSAGVTPYEDLLNGSSDRFQAGKLVAEFDPEDVAVIMYTSGTTGVPKGAMQSHKNIFSFVEGFKAMSGLSQKDRLLGVVPLFNNFGASVMLFNTLYHGATIVFLERFDAEIVVQNLKKYRITFMAGTATMYIFMNQAVKPDKDHFPDFRRALAAGSAMPIEHIEEFEAKFKTKLLNFYGMTETQGLTGLHPKSNPKPASIGMALPGVKIRIVDDNDRELPRGQEGEVVAIGDSIVKGYWNKPEATKEVWKNGWFHTGDICLLDKDGHYYFVDRKKDIIITGGTNIYPRELEDLLYTNPKVQMVAVVGVPDKVKQELAKAYIVLKTGKTSTEKEMIDYCHKRVAKFKAPRMVEFVDSLPLATLGKIDKKELRKRAKASSN